ncbi:MAG TPA: polysaccharide deacetylase family protein [Bacteroidota bacterium]|nr:polysaccharide deacetylase family protein [Bacteroidota bacterium]
MNILHVLSQFEVTGAEAYAAALIDAQIADGHEVVVVSDTFTIPTRATYIAVPIGIRSYSRRIRNIATLTKIIRSKSIDIVHAHSRAASWVSLFATRLTNRPLVSTVHGRQHVHTSSKAFSVYGRDVIAVSPALKEHLVNDLHFRPSDIVVIPNCILFDYWESKRQSATPASVAHEGDCRTILFVGRLTGPKGDVVRLLLDRVLPDILAHRRVQFKTVGGMIVPEDIPQLVKQLNTRMGRDVAELGGFKTDVASDMLAADLIIGSGRVVPEAIVLHKPVIAFGESAYEGPILSSTFRSAVISNFGDTGKPVSPAPDLIRRDILATLDHPPDAAELETLCSLARRKFDVRNVEARIQGVYERAEARLRSPQSIPVLMYHRVLEQGDTTPGHGIWVSASQFRSQLASLKRRGFQTITFRQYERFVRGELTLPSKPIILTFDDGYEDNYRVAFPLLQEHGFSAVIYAVTDRSRRTNFWDAGEPPARLMTDAQMQELQRAGFEIGSHTASHAHLPRESVESVEHEVRLSKETLEQILGQAVISFAYPYGEISDPVKESVREAGYRFAAAADSGPLTLFEDFLEIRRTQVFPWTDRVGFWKKTLPIYLHYKALKSSNG